MATPHVAGAAAILLQRHPDWNRQQLKDALMSSTKPLGNIKPYQGGTGRLDVAEAVLGDIIATGSLDFGFFSFPRNKPQPVEKTITYSNNSDNPATLTLSASFTDQVGIPAPAEMVKLSNDKITVPANGTTEVTVTVDPQLGSVGAHYQGQIIAKTGDKLAVHTAIGMVNEKESYNLTLKAIDRDGSENYAYVAMLGTDMEPTFIDVYGEQVMRLPVGTYSAMSLMTVDSYTDHAGGALVGNPEIHLNKNQTVELDGRKAQEITVRVPKKTEPSYRRLEYYRSIDSHEINDIWMVPSTVDKVYANPTEPVKEGKFEMLTRWRLIKPVLTVRFQGKELDDSPQAGSTLLQGNLHLKAVYAEQGSVEDYTGLNAKNKIVIVKRSDEVLPPERAENAMKAGAKLLIVVNDNPQELSEYVGNPDYTDKPIAVSTISGMEGTELINAARSRNLTLDVQGSPVTPYVYDLLDPHTNTIPASLSYSPKNSELAKIEARYYSDRKAPGAEFRYDFRPYTWNGVGSLHSLTLPSVRTEWVSVAKDSVWRHEVQVTDSTWEMRESATTYKPGERLKQDWFAPVVRPRFGDGYWMSYRAGEEFGFNVPAWGDSGKDHTGSDVGTEMSKQTLKFYHGSTLIDQVDGETMFPPGFYPTDRTQYRLISDAERDREQWHTSIRTHTEWAFWSETREVFFYNLPMLSLDYQVDTNIKGDVRAGHPTKLTLSAAKVDYAIGYGKLNGASLDISFDEGKTWRKTKLVQLGENWIANISNPFLPGGSVSLRASAWDDAGNKIKQEVIKAYGLK